MGSLACVFSVLRVSGQLVGRILNGVTKYGQRTNIFTDRQKKVAPQTPLRPGLGLQPSDKQRTTVAVPRVLNRIKTHLMWLRLQWLDFDAWLRATKWLQRQWLAAASMARLVGTPPNK